MGQIWKEKFDPDKHQDKMDSFRNIGLTEFTKDNLREVWVYFVHECNFTFTFMDLKQAKECLAYFSEKIHSSTRVNIGFADHWEVQRWYERLPGHLKSKKNRAKIVKTLKKLIGDETKIEKA